MRMKKPKGYKVLQRILKEKKVNSAKKAAKKATWHAEY
jgi:hypothetical protein